MLTILHFNAGILALASKLAGPGPPTMGPKMPPRHVRDDDDVSSSCEEVAPREIFQPPVPWQQQ